MAALCKDHTGQDRLTRPVPLQSGGRVKESKDGLQLLQMLIGAVLISSHRLRSSQVQLPASKTNDPGNK